MVMAAKLSRKLEVRVLGVLIEGSRVCAPWAQPKTVVSCSRFLHHWSYSPKCQWSTKTPTYKLTHRSRRGYAKGKVLESQGLVGDTPDEVVDTARRLVEAQTIPDEKIVLDTLKTAQNLAKSIPSDAILDHESSTYSTRQAAIEKLSKSVFEVVSSPNVFITPRILEVYVYIQSALRCPETLVPIFEQYASKPVPEPGTKPIQYKPQHPKKISAAIPLHIARAAIEAAIKSRNLPICFDIITNTVCAPAYKRNQWVRRGTLPVTAALFAPLAAWQIATYYGTFQDMLDPHVARGLAFAGILTYLGATSTLGYIAVTTSNDQMQRVTWVDGTPLHERWIREDERALLDQVAVGLGYQEKSRRGEEEGQDWDALREWIGIRGMILDRVSLMEGME